MKMSSTKKRLETVFGHLRNGDAPPSISMQPVNSGSTRYRYSQDGGILSDEQRAFYDQNGYLVIKELVSSSELQVYKERFQNICSRKVTVPGLTIMRDVAIAKSEYWADESAITKIQDFQYDEVLSQYFQLPSIIPYVTSIIGEDIMAMHTMLINKPPDPGTKTSRHPLHQDLHYFPFRPADLIVCSWTAMEHVHQQNGCLVVLPGTHRTGVLLQHEYPNWEGGVNKMYHGVRDFDPSLARVHLEMGPGDTVFFHPLLIHGSGMNRTKGFRKAISCHFANSNCYYIDVKGTTQEGIAKEVVDLAVKILGGKDASEISYQDVWKLRSRLVHGKEGTLTMDA